MSHRKLAAALGTAALVFAAEPAAAETLAVDGQVVVRESSIAKPTRGMSMSAVEARFGAPANKRQAVGSPPITRWDYGSFVVFFEHDHVVHAVALGG
jgi:hypothetical protein